MSPQLAFAFENALSCVGHNVLLYEDEEENDSGKK